MMCPSEVSGVLFTANPVNPSLGQILIESSYGLGEAIVLGKVTPDRFVLDKQTLQIEERHIAVKEKIVITLARDGARKRVTKDAASLNDDQIEDLARLGLRVEDYFKMPCDIEWALSDRQFYLLQARAIKGTASGGCEPPVGSMPIGGSRSPLAEDLEQIRAEEISALRVKAVPSGLG